MYQNKLDEMKRLRQDEIEYVNRLNERNKAQQEKEREMKRDKVAVY